MSSPTQRTLKLLREGGMVCDITEHWQPWTKQRRDLFHCIDIVAVEPGRCVGVQATSFSSKSNRLKKIASAKIRPLLTAWLSSGAEFWIISWRKLKVQRGGKAVRWHSDVEIITLESLASLPEEPAEDSDNAVVDGGS